MLKILFTTTFLVAASSAAFAQNITPNHVYQVAANISAHLEKLHVANYSKPEGAAIENQARKPRHVLQAGREVFKKVQTLRYINGLKPHFLDVLPVRAVTPGDVKELVDRIYIDLSELKDVYDIEEDIQSVALPEGKNPTDVYNELRKISASIDALGIPSIVPNDVYQVASALLADLEIVAQSQGVQYSDGMRDVHGKSPFDVYQEGVKLLSSLKELSVANGGLEVAGGIVMPTVKSDKVTPADVLDLLNTALAEVGAMKVSAGISQETIIPTLEGGKTPSNVYAALEKAGSIVANLK